LAYDARIYEVMIASPSDVPHERRLISQILHQWNSVNAKDRGILLMPITWETHASPAMGMRAQEVINTQVLKDADLLVAVFWTRLGTPTGSSASGTVEEIEKHISAGKPAMIYFSSQPVRPDSVDTEQYRALLEFKDKCRSTGLIEEYEELGEFQEKFARQLAQTVLRNFVQESNDHNNVFRESAPAIPTLSESAKELLSEAAKDSRATILRSRVLRGLRIQTNGRQFAETGSARSEAKWEAALQELYSSGLIQDLGYKGEIYQLTQAGYDAADRLESSGPATMPETDVQRKARKILNMKGTFITLRWLNPSDKAPIAGRVRSEADMIIADCDEDTVFLEAPMGAGRQSLPLNTILIGFDDQRHRPALEVTA